MLNAPELNFDVRVSGLGSRVWGLGFRILVSVADREVVAGWLVGCFKIVNSSKGRQSAHSCTCS